MNDLQAELESEWSRAEAYLDTGKPLTDKFWANMKKRVWEPMERYEALEASYRRAGSVECFCGGGKMFVTCRVCLAEPQTPSLL